MELNPVLTKLKRKKVVNSKSLKVRSSRRAKVSIKKDRYNKKYL
jgi:hypothetical protein